MGVVEVETSSKEKMEILIEVYIHTTLLFPRKASQQCSGLPKPVFIEVG
jgi:hypothetical protein